MGLVGVSGGNMDLLPDTNEIYRNLYRLSDAFNNRAVRFNFNEGPGKIIIANEEFRKYSDKRWFPFGFIEIFPDFGNTTYDILWSTSIGLTCISQKLQNILKQNKITGWEIFPVLISDPKNKLKDKFDGFRVTGPYIGFDYRRASLEDRPAPSPTGQSYQVYKGYYFDLSKYDGSDFFLVGGTIIMTKRVKDLLVYNKVRNICITPILEVEINKSIIDVIENRFS
jgi:hypothetical protein